MFISLGSVAVCGLCLKHIYEHHMISCQLQLRIRSHIWVDHLRPQTKDHLKVLRCSGAGHRAHRAPNRANPALVHSISQAKILKAGFFCLKTSPISLGPLLQHWKISVNPIESQNPLQALDGP